MSSDNQKKLTSVEWTAADQEFMTKYLEQIDAREKEEQSKAAEPPEPPQPNVHLTWEEAQLIHRLIEQEIHQEKKRAKINMEGKSLFDIRQQEAELYKSENFPYFRNLLAPIRKKVSSVK